MILSCTCHLFFAEMPHDGNFAGGFDRNDGAAYDASMMSAI
jgi:hypothetical protein